ncbi:MAG: hypothetical protein NC318_05680 [Blautia sp.]|nr:hypothetical protein [Lachnoclostridium sp.]MCM1211075.1 hypothetical protein [Blautia sp.]
MKYQISITKRNIITVVIFMAGLLFLCRGIRSCYLYRHALPIEALNAQNFQKGTYIVDTIDTYIGKRNPTGNRKFLGVSQSLIAMFGKVYDFYTIPTGQDSYVVIMVSDKTILQKLEAFVNGQGDPVPFTGEVIESPTEINYAWYAPIENFSTEKILGRYVIRETSPQKPRNTIYLGIVLFIIAVLLFWGAGGMQSFIEKEILPEKPAPPI